jgi:hypothetical protein
MFCQNRVGGWGVIVAGVDVDDGANGMGTRKL